MIVELPNGQELEFPDDTSPEVMRNAIIKNFPEYAGEYQGQQQEQPQSKGLQGIGADVIESLKGLPSAAYEMITELPSQVRGAAQFAGQHPFKAIGDVAAGVGEGVIGAANIPSNIANYLAAKELLPEALAKRVPSIGDLGIEKRLGLGEEEGEQFLRALGSIAPYAKAGAFTGNLAKRAAGGAAYGIGQNQDPLQAIALGEGLGQAARGIPKIAEMIEARKPERALRGELSPEELQANVRAAQGTETGLGDILGNPALKRELENQLASIEGSGATEVLQRNKAEIHSRGKSLFDELTKDIKTEDAAGDLQEALKQAERETAARKNKLYGKVNEIAEKHNIFTDRSNMMQQAEDILSDINSDPHLRNLADKNVIKTLQGMTRNAADAVPDEYSLKKTDLLRGELNNLSHEAFSKGETRLSNIYRKLKDAAEKDVNTAIENSGIDELKNARDEAMNFYRQEYAQFDDPLIQKFTRRGGDPDTILQSFLKTGGVSERNRLLKKLESKLPEDSKNLITQSYFSRAVKDGEFNPVEFSKLFRKLSDEQKSVLIPDEKMLEKLSDYNRLTSKNTESIYNMHNPKTGARVLDLFDKRGQLLSALGALAHGGIPEAMLAYFAIPEARKQFAKGRVKKLTSPEYRENLVKKMLELSEPVKRDRQPYIEAGRKAQPLELLMTKALGDKDNQDGIR